MENTQVVETIETTEINVNDEIKTLKEKLEALKGLKKENREKAEKEKEQKRLEKLFKKLNEVCENTVIKEFIIEIEKSKRDDFFNYYMDEKINPAFTVYTDSGFVYDSIKTGFICIRVFPRNKF